MTIVHGSSGAEDLEADLWVGARLNGSSYLNNTLQLNNRIYNGLAPSDIQYPSVVYSCQSAVDLKAVNTGQTRMAVDMVYLIAVMTGTTSMDNAKPMVDAIDRLMTVPTDTVNRTLSDGSQWQTLFTSVRDAPLSFSENHNGLVVWHKGARYRINAQSFMLVAPTG